MPPRIADVFDRIVTLCAILAGVLLVAQMVAITVDVFCRFAFNAPINGVNALTEWSLVYIAFLGAAWLQRVKGHVSVDMLIGQVPLRAARGLAIFGLALGLLVTLVIGVYGLRVTWIKFVEQEYDFFKLSWMPIWVVYAVIPLGAVLWFVQLCRDLATAFTDPKAHLIDRGLGD